MPFMDEHRALQRTVEQFVINELNPYVADWEKAGSFPAHEVFKKMGDLGLLGINKPTHFGGMGQDYCCALVAAETLGNCLSGSVTLAISTQMDIATPVLARFGSDELRDEFLRPAISGAFIAAIAIDEAKTGGDISGIQTVAQRRGDDYVINGEKAAVANAAQADFFCVMANTSDDKPLFNKSLIIVPRQTPGVSVGTPLTKDGARTLHIAPVYFDAVRVPVRYRVGAENQGFPMRLIQFQEEHLCRAASILLGMERCLHLTTEHSRKRDTFGQPLMSNQYTHFQIAEMKTEVEALRSLIYRAGDEYAAGKDVMQLAAMAKLKSARLVRHIADRCLQLWRPSGFLWESPIARYYHDAYLISAIDSNTDEMMLDIICKTLNLLPEPEPLSRETTKV